MEKINNTEKISKLIFTHTVFPFCPLGKVNYSAEITADINLGDYYFEYVELTNTLNDLNGQSLTLEQLAVEVSKIVKMIFPLNAEIKIVGNTNKHLPVTIIKNI